MSETPAPSHKNRSIELRASFDVMFEALAHIQASLEGTTPEEHEVVYRKFKRALQERYEHALAQRREGAGSVDPDTQSAEAGAGEREASAPIPGQGDGMVQGEDASQARPPELEAVSDSGRAGDEEDGEKPGFSTLWPTD